MELRKPKWWLLYSTVPLMIGALVLEARLPNPETVHRVFELGIVLVEFSLMGLWLRANADALQNEEMEQEHWVLAPSPCDANSPTADEYPGEQTDEEGESSLRHATGIDQDILPSVKVFDDSAENPYHLEASPTKGRFN